LKSITLLMVSYLREKLNLHAEHGIPFGVFVIQPKRLEIFQAAYGVEAARAILRVVAHTFALAGELGKLPNKISLEGHTDAKPFAKDTTYGNWELSADRANAARRLMQQNGVREDQVVQGPWLRRSKTAQTK
jgi:hypothetical protein